MPKLFKCPICGQTKVAPESAPPLCNKDNVTMVLNVPVTKPKSMSFRGATYDVCRQYKGKDYWMRLDVPAVQALRAGSKLSTANLAVYEKAMQGEILEPGDTGHDGVKCEGGDQWVIKLKIATAKANAMDNCLSPMADLVSENGGNFLNFNQLANRH